MWNSKPVVAVFGSSQVIEGDDAYGEARLLGRLLARAGFVVCNGGYGGIMEATARGASDMEGTTIGLTLDTFRSDGSNPYISRVIRNATLFERLSNFVGLADAFIALHGGVGTLAEFGLVWNMFQTRQINIKPFILVGDNWPRLVEVLRQNMEIRDKDLKLLHMVSKPEDAVDFLKQHVRSEQ